MPEQNNEQKTSTTKLWGDEITLHKEPHICKIDSSIIQHLLINDGWINWTENVKKCTQMMLKYLALWNQM